MWNNSIKPFLVVCVYRFFLLTWRISVKESDAFKEHLKTGGAFLFAHWHGDELALLCLVRKYRLATMISQSKDGHLMNHVYTSFGGTTTRGSSSKGAVSALRGLIRLIKKNHSTSIAVDGPRGPIYEVKPGVFELSRLSGAPIFCLGVAASSKFQFEKSWNKAILPKLFSKIQISIDFPQKPLTKSEDPKSEILAKHLKEQLFNARRQASKLIESTPV